MTVFSKDKIPLLIALLCALIAGVCVFMYLQSAKEEALAQYKQNIATYGSEQVEVFVPLRNIAPGEEIGSSDIQSRTWLVEMLPEDPVLEREDIVGHTSDVGLVKGEVISAARMAQSSESLQVPDGKSALSVRIKDASLLSDGVHAKDYVDIYAQGEMGLSKLLSNVQVLSIPARDKTSANSVILAVESNLVQEVLKVALKSELSIVLPGKDSAIKEEAEIKSDALNGTDDARATNLEESEE